jgi:hypothetical protein
MTPIQLVYVNHRNIRWSRSFDGLIVITSFILGAAEERVRLVVDIDNIVYCDIIVHEL